MNEIGMSSGQNRINNPNRMNMAIKKEQSKWMYCNKSPDNEAMEQKG